MLTGVKEADYTGTLGALDRGLKSVVSRLDRMEAPPALKLTPKGHARSLDQAGRRQPKRSVLPPTAPAGAKRAPCRPRASTFSPAPRR